ncbi:unnamed protein product [Prunus brigantina]
MMTGCRRHRFCQMMAKCRRHLSRLMMAGCRRHRTRRMIKVCITSLNAERQDKVCRTACSLWKEQSGFSKFPSARLRVVNSHQPEHGLAVRQGSTETKIEGWLGGFGSLFFRHFDFGRSNLASASFLRECFCFGSSAPCVHGVGKVTGSGFFLAPPPCPLHSPCRSARVFWGNFWSFSSRVVWVPEPSAKVGSWDCRTAT